MKAIPGRLLPARVSLSYAAEAAQAAVSFFFRQ